MAADRTRGAGWLFASLRGYRAAWLPGDALAALTLAAIAIPEQLATARLVGMPPIAGLIAFAAGTIAFALFGVNRQTSVGADSTIAPIMAGTLVGIAAVGTPDYTGAAAALALLVGVILVLSAPLRLGWIADLMSVPVATGFLAGIGVHIIVGQAPTLLGIDGHSGSLIVRLRGIVDGLTDANMDAVAIGLAVLAVCLLADWIGSRVPGPLVGLSVAGLVAWILDLQAHGVTLLGPLPVAVSNLAPALPGWSTVTHLLPLALIVAAICMMQTAAVERNEPSDAGDGDLGRDFAAVGAGSILSGLLGAFAVNASPPRTAIVGETGGKSQICGLLAVLATGLVLLFGTGALAYVPHAALGGVLVFIGIRIMRVRQMARVLQHSPQEFPLVAVSMMLVVILPIDIGVGLSIVLSLLHSIYVIARPKCTELARVPGTTIWWTLRHGEAGEHEPAVLVFALGAPVNFINARYMVVRLKGVLAAAVHPYRLVVIEASGVIDVDFTGSQILQRAFADLKGRGIDVAIARLESERAKEAAARTGLITALGADHKSHSVDEAIRAWKRRQTEAKE